MSRSALRLGLVVLALFGFACRQVKYTRFELGASRQVLCPQADTVADATDEQLAALVKPQTEEAIAFCEGEVK